MGTLSVIYAAFGYLALLGAILWGMLFVGGSGVPNSDSAGAAAPLESILADLGLLLLLALLHRLLSRGMLRHFTRRALTSGLKHSTQAWAAAAVLAVVYVGWQPLPHTLWVAPEPLSRTLSGLFYLGWSLILIGAFVATHLDFFGVTGAARGGVSVADGLRQPLFVGILIAVWATRTMTVGHLLLAAAITMYLMLDGIWVLLRRIATRESDRVVSLQGQRLAR